MTRNVVHLLNNIVVAVSLFLLNVNSWSNEKVTGHIIAVGIKTFIL